MDSITKNKMKLIFFYFVLWVLLFVALYLSFGVHFVDTKTTKSIYIGLYAGAIAILLAACKILEITYNKTKNQVLDKVSKYFTNGALIFIKRLFKVTAFVILVLVVPYVILNIKGINFKPFAFVFSKDMKLSIEFITCFLFGGVFSFLSVLVTAFVTSKTTTRSSQFYAESNSTALKQLFDSGVSCACMTIGFAIIPLTLLYTFVHDYYYLTGFVFGAAIVSLLNNVSSAIARQAVDSANDVIVGFVAEIQKKDRRNPLLLLNGVSKGVFGVNILSSDLFLSFSLILVCAMAIGDVFSLLMGIFLPVIIAASGIFASVIVILFVRIEKSNNPVRTLFISMFCSNILLVLISCFLVHEWLPHYMGLILSVLIGVIGSYLMCFAHSNLTFSKYKPILNVSNAAISGFSSTFRQTIKEGLGGNLAPAVIFFLTIVLAFVLPGGVQNPSLGLYGIVLAILSSVTGVGLMISINAFGLNTSSVDTVLESYEEDIYDNRYPQASVLSTTGQHIVSLGKNYINAITILASLAGIIAYAILANLEQVDIINPYVLSSIVLGAAMPFLYSTCVMGIVSKTARRLVLEVKKQIKKAPQILRFEMRPNYEDCVEISAINSSIQVIINTLLVLAIGAFVAIKLKEEALCGFVFGAVISSFGLIFVTSGTSLVARGAKKYFENHFSHIKNLEEYNSININEAIFSSMKDILVPSLNSLVKFLVVAALALIPLFS
ncbi:sodium/proton-translocating pyrophosphatase [bacterium]|nr:sodium/proton-translocating pyrophosphatase [bacterium]MBQ9149647.1 sodium/proton-translocating pyrophosphatase [bacterium]